MEEILTILESFEPISLEEMSEVKLLNRVDIKYTFNIKQLPEILKSLVDEYRIFASGHVRANHYETLYFDTKDFDLYNKHHCGKLNRFKIRYRCYKDTSITFFEVKFKNNKSRTIKERIRRNSIDKELKGEIRDFIFKKTPIDPDELIAQLWIYYIRITLVNKYSRERLTIDLNLSYKGGDQTVAYPKLVIAELKQDKNMKSCFALLMRDMRIHPVSLSKYCFGIYNVYNNIKINNFKQKFRIVKKIAS